LDALPNDSPKLITPNVLNENRMRILAATFGSAEKLNVAIADYTTIPQYDNFTYI